MARAPGATSGARTPEELETLFEDALLLRDCQVLPTLFASGATLVIGDEPPIRGSEAIAHVVLAMRDGVGTYIADPRRGVVARDIALIIAEEGVNVVHRDGDGAWRYLIVLRMEGDSNG